MQKQTSPHHPQFIHSVYHLRPIWHAQLKWKRYLGIYTLHNNNLRIMLIYEFHITIVFVSEWWPHLQITISLLINYEMSNLSLPFIFIFILNIQMWSLLHTPSRFNVLYPPQSWKSIVCAYMWEVLVYTEKITRISLLVVFLYQHHHHIK